LRVVRLDTCEEIETKKMSDSECQEILPLEEVSAPEAGVEEQPEE